MSDAREAKIATSHYDSSTAQRTSVTLLPVPGTSIGVDVYELPGMSYHRHLVSSL